MEDGEWYDFEEPVEAVSESASSYVLRELSVPLNLPQDAVPMAPYKEEQTPCANISKMYEVHDEEAYSRHAVLQLSIEAFDIEDFLNEKQSNWTLSISDFKDIILKERVPCQFFLTMFGGLPHSGKSTLIREFLQTTLRRYPDDSTSSDLLQHCNERGLSSYSISILGHELYKNRPWFCQTRHMLHRFCCGAIILRDCLLLETKLKLTDTDHIKKSNVFKNELLNAHIHRVYSDISQISILDANLQQTLSTGAVFINIFDFGNSKGIIEFMTLISQYVRHFLGFFCMTSDDVKHLDDLDYPRYEDFKSFVRYIAAINLGYSGRKPITFIITAKQALPEGAKEKLKVALQQALAREIRKMQLSLATLPQAVILVLDSAANESLKELKYHFENTIKQQSPMRESIKMSWIFLRSSLYFTNRVMMSYDELKLMAAELNIDSDREINEFLDTFTNFGSILYFQKIEQLKDTVILQPVKFVNLLGNLFHRPGSDTSDFNGIFNEDVIKSLLPDIEVERAIMDTLCSLGLATKTNDKKVDRRLSPLSGKVLVFVPLARIGTFSQKTSNVSLFITYKNSLMVPHDFKAFFSTELLKDNNITLVSTTEVNVVKFLYKRHEDCPFSLIFQGTYIEIFLEQYKGFERSDICIMIFQHCNEALTKITSLLGEFSYQWALQCIGVGQSVEFEYLREEMCRNCKTSKSLLRLKWKEIIQQHLKMQERLMRDDIYISPRELLELAMELKDCQSNTINLATQLGIRHSRDFQQMLSQYSPWQRVLLIFWTWEKKVGPEQATKQRLSEALRRLGINIPKVLQ